MLPSDYERDHVMYQWQRKENLLTEGKVSNTSWLANIHIFTQKLAFLWKSLKDLQYFRLLSLRAWYHMLFWEIMECNITKEWRLQMEDLCQTAEQNLQLTTGPQDNNNIWCCIKFRYYRFVTHFYTRSSLNMNGTVRDPGPLQYCVTMYGQPSLINIPFL
jgi:hypothetical protein